MLVGVLSSAMDEEFARVILGDSYIEMTKENIASGDPMAVYKQKGALGMSLGIAGNNLFVAFFDLYFRIIFWYRYDYYFDSKWRNGWCFSIFFY